MLIDRAQTKVKGTNGDLLTLRPPAGCLDALAHALERPTLPAEHFVASRTGRVLNIGLGTC